MAVPLHTPRINNNDDTVRLAKVFVKIGGSVRQGDPVADIETDKATFTVEAEGDGVLLGVCAEPGDTIDVGSILAWFGSTADEPVPSARARTPHAVPVGAGADQAGSARVSLKAALLLARYGLDASKIPAAGDRLTEAEVESYAQVHRLNADALAELPRANGSAPIKPSLPPSPGKATALTPNERGMLRAVEWHRDEAVAAYAEIRYDPSEWDAYAAKFQQAHGTLLNPLLSLFAWKLVQLAKARPGINTTMSGDSRYVYEHVNLGFTVQAGERLYVVVVEEAERLDEAEFVDRLGALQRTAMKHSLRPNESSAATIAFSSMARWPVGRHIPVLAPHTAMMVAHTAPNEGSATLGATYDHRVLTGADAVRTLQGLSRPGEL
jgi:pyruvate dehydrogenase E2 component (dihydrolipoamide acetyltransferase)